MQQNATPEAPVLSAQQEAALAAILAGKTVTDAATIAGVDRSTVHRWMKDDLYFQLCLDRARRELREALQARLMAMAEQAMDTVQKRIKNGDPSTALAIIKGVGLLRG